MPDGRPHIPFPKRAMDVVLAGLALVALAPVFALAAAVVKLSSPGPVFYRALRAGYRGRPFKALKFRTMHVGSDRRGAITANEDPRVFRTGAFLRLLKIDELPQLCNVLKGEMSLVGPRPEDPSIVANSYSADQRRVLEVAPGLTGLPQIRFFPEFPLPQRGGQDAERYYRDVILPMRLAMDLEYLRNQSFWLDCYLIAATLYLILVKSWLILIFGQKPAVLARSS